MANPINGTIQSAPKNRNIPGRKEYICPVEKFMQDWPKNYTIYDDLAKGAEQLFYQKFCATPPGHFSISPVKCLIQARAKSAHTMKAAIIRREKERMTKTYIMEDGTEALKGPFETPEQIQAAMPDLAGIRVILFFPDDDVKIDEFIKENTKEADESIYWGVNQDGNLKTKAFSDIKKKNDRFVGYRAVHYRVQLKNDLIDTSTLADGSMTLKEWWKKQWKASWAGRKLEIQVTSMTMYAWQEVHHDLIHKSYAGTLSSDEICMLDMVNGLVHTNEIALNQFHRSLNIRLELSRTKFKDAFSLREWIINYFRRTSLPVHSDRYLPTEYTEILLYVLRLFDLDTPEKLQKTMETPERLVDRIDSAEHSDEFRRKFKGGQINRALGLIIRCKTLFEMHFMRGIPCESSTDLSAWILFNICEKESPFRKPTSEDEEKLKEFIIIIHLVMDTILYGAKINPPCDTLFTAYLPYCLEPNSPIDQIMTWCGQKPPGNSRRARAVSLGTWNGLLESVKLDGTNNQSEHKTRSLVSLALALLGVTAIPVPSNISWMLDDKNKFNILWPGIVNVKSMAKSYKLDPEAFQRNQRDPKHLNSHQFLVMVDNKWMQQSMFHYSPNHHEWKFVRTGIPEVMMQSLNLESLSSTYSSEWLVKDSSSYLDEWISKPEEEVPQEITSSLTWHVGMKSPRINRSEDI